MIALLKGTVVEVSSEVIVLDVNGVGYEVQSPASVLNLAVIGEKLTLPIYTVVKEDSISLYGFVSVVEKSIFISLLKVNGVGPKLALRMVSSSTAEQLKSMVEAGDVRGLSLIPKVGKKTAEQVILTLKGKLDFVESSSVSAVGKVTGSVRSQISSALVNLGFKVQDVEKVVGQFNSDVTLEEGVRAGLAALSSRSAEGER